MKFLHSLQMLQAICSLFNHGSNGRCWTPLQKTQGHFTKHSYQLLKAFLPWVWLLIFFRIDLVEFPWLWVHHGPCVFKHLHVQSLPTFRETASELTKTSFIFIYIGSSKIYVCIKIWTLLINLITITAHLIQISIVECKHYYSCDHTKLMIQHPQTLIWNIILRKKITCLLPYFKSRAFCMIGTAK